MGPDEDLPTLIKRKDHVNVLRYARAHQLRDADLVIEHGLAVLGKDLSKKLSNESARLAILEQVCLAALDVQKLALADSCLAKIQASSIDDEAARFRILQARRLEAEDDKNGASIMYEEILKENPSNLLALKRMYCLASTPSEKVEALNAYLQQNMVDTVGWHEMAKLRMDIGDYKGAVFALEEVVLGCPLDSSIHCQLAEVYATLGGPENLLLARKHMAQSLELDASNKRAMFGLVSVANDYIEATQGRKGADEHELAVARELVKYGADKVLRSYKGTKMYAPVQRVMQDYTQGL